MTDFETCARQGKTPSNTYHIPLSVLDLVAILMCYHSVNVSVWVKMKGGFSVSKAELAKLWESVFREWLTTIFLDSHTRTLQVLCGSGIQRSPAWCSTLCTQTAGLCGHRRFRKRMRCADKPGFPGLQWNKRWKPLFLQTTWRPDKKECQGQTRWRPSKQTGQRTWRGTYLDERCQFLSKRRCN